MKLAKSLLLGSAAGFAAVAGAQAADLPSRKAAPVEYVRVCSAYGAGFFFIPGTDTCLRVGGRVRAEYTFGERWSERQDAYGTRALGRIFVDARTATAYGTLRAFVRYDINTRTGTYRYGGTNAGTNNFSLNGRLNEGNTAILDKGFVQFGPITAGKAQSFFDFYAADLGFSSLRTSDRTVNLLAYTASFGGGFTATLSFEDGNTSGFNQVLNAAGAAGGRTYQGSVMPDIVASLRVDQGWGSAQLSGAISDRSTNRVAVGPVLDSGDEFGYAISGGVKFNLPMLAAGDQLWLQATYADGAIGYLGYGNAVGYGRALATIGDFTVNPITGIGTKSTTGFTLAAAFRHYWTPQIRSDFIASYSELKLGSVAGPVVAGVATTLKGIDPKELILGANLVWSPVSGLDIGVEVLYSRVEFSRRVLDIKNVALGAPARLVKSDDAVAARLRIQRDF